MTKWLASFWVLVCVAGLATRADAAWPNDKVMTFISPFPAGSGTDLTARLIADSLSRRWGNSVIVEDRGGASGTIAQNYVARAKPDGYTFILTSPSPSANAKLIFPSLPYDPLTDFTYIMRVTSDAMVLYAGPRMEMKTLQEFVTYAKANPGKVQFGNPGLGTYAQMTQLTMQDLLGTTFNLIQYKGGPQMVTDLLDKQIDAVIDLTGGYMPQVKAGNLHALAVFGKQGDPRLPGVKTAIEQGVNLSVEAFYGLEGPKGVPRDIVEKMNQAVTDILLHDAAVRDKLFGIGSTPAPSTPEEFEAIIRSELEKWRPIVTKYNIRAE